jgi:hypothetical protein
MEPVEPLELAELQLNSLFAFNLVRTTETSVLDMEVASTTLASVTHKLELDLVTLDLLVTSPSFHHH